MTPEKDYKDQGNHFANWLTAIIISNYVYLVRLVETGEMHYLPNWTLLNWSFTIANLSLVFIFFHKGLGVVAARLRLNMQPKSWQDIWQNITESLRSTLILLFVFTGIIPIILSGVIIKLIYEAKNM